MEKYRNENGFIDISNLKSNSKFYSFWFEYDGIKYYFKKRRSSLDVYNELIAEELAKDFDILSAHYDLAIYNGNKGVISKNFISENDKYIPMKDILINHHEKLCKVDKLNNLEDIWETLEDRYKNEEIVEKLMNQLVDIFMFDSLIGNYDRHVSNLGIIENKNGVNFAPLFDNEKILSDSILNGVYSLGVDRDDYYLKILKENFLIKFFRVSIPEYIEYYKSKLWIISDENIDKVLKRVEDRTNSMINENLKQKIRDKFEINRNMIENVLDEINQRKLG